jgi:hypothetical protein
LRKADGRDARFRQVLLLRGNVAMQAACTRGPVARIALVQSQAADPREYHERRRDSTRISLVAISGLLLVHRCTGLGSFGQVKGRSLHRLGFVWPRRHPIARPTTRGSAIWGSL